MIYLDLKDASRLGRSTKALLLAFYSESHWAIQLELKFRTIKYKEISSLESYKWIRRLGAIIWSKWRPQHFNPTLSEVESFKEFALDHDLCIFLTLYGPAAITDQETMKAAIEQSTLDKNTKSSLLAFCETQFQHLVVFASPK